MKGNGSWGGGSVAKIDRKAIERNRRIQIRSLCFKVYSLIPKLPNTTISNDATTQLDQLEETTSYIMKLKENVEKLKKLKELGKGEESEEVAVVTEEGETKMRLPMVEVRQNECSLEVVIVTWVKENHAFYQVIGILEEEGADVVNASFSVVDDKMFYTIHCQLQAISSGVGLGTSRLSKRLKELMTQ